jgi:bla regulator protein blaR1
MLTWMLYVLVITLLLSGAALAAERAAKLRRARTRWIWMVTILASLVIPTLIASVSIQVPNLLTPTASRKAIPLREMTSVQVVPLTWVQEHTGNVVAVHKENRTLQTAWLSLSVALIAALMLNAAHVSWRKRRWTRGTVAGVTVYIAPDVGPAVVGLLRPRIVVPGWLLEAQAPVQAMVIAHERGHLIGYDPQLLTVALCLVVLMPWNLPLWWQLHRLRYAIEVDCDARVLESGLDAREYGEMLLDVSQRPSAYIGAVAAVAESRSFLEDRIAIMVRDPADWGWVAGLFGTLAAALVAVAAQVAPPNVASADRERGPLHLTAAVLDQYVGSYLRGANIIFSVTRDGERLLLEAWAHPPVEVYADTDMNFTLRTGGPRFSFMHAASGQATELIAHYDIGGISFSVPIPRIDASTARAIKANNEARAQSQTPAPGSDVALRHLVDGIFKGKPNYDQMAPWYAELVREGSPATRLIYGKRGAVRSIEFRHVDQNGGDVYEVRQEGGVSWWTIFLDSNGLIEDADDDPGDG